ncbi:MAG: enoyl-CoA hydratase/isomerase family protein [Lysobacterales bacterium]|jgi:enoyl-CoA hydratase/carnithine racemase
MTDELLLKIDGPVAYLTLNRPRAMNALNLAILDAFGRYLPEVRTDPAIRVLVLAGNGPAFCAGADLKEFLAHVAPSPGEPDFLDRAADVMNSLRVFPKPVVAALNGTTLAGGLELAMCADIVLAAESARIGDAHANYGVYPGAGGAAVLPRLVPLNVAMYLLLTGKTLSAAEMQSFGFIAEVHPDDELAEAVAALARLLASRSPAVLRRMKAVARTASDKTRTDALWHEQAMLREHLRSWDLKEGLAAFAEKREPCFRGI